MTILFNSTKRSEYHSQRLTLNSLLVNSILSSTRPKIRKNFTESLLVRHLSRTLCNLLLTVLNSVVGNDCELVTAILIRNEKSSIPLPSPELLRVRQAHASYYDFTRATSQILDPSSSNDSGVQLMLELKNYLRLKCQERDSGLIRKLLGEVSTGLALEELGGPLMELIKRIHKVGSAGQAVLKIEEGLDQFIVGKSRILIFVDS